MDAVNTQAILHDDVTFAAAPSCSCAHPTCTLDHYASQPSAPSVTVDELRLLDVARNYRDAATRAAQTQTREDFVKADALAGMLLKAAKGL